MARDQLSQEGELRRTDLTTAKTQQHIRHAAESGERLVER
jgi:hypothetical protein